MTSRTNRTNRQNIRIPNLPIGPIVDSQGNPTAPEIVFRQILITSLQQNFGAEGLVPPSQKNAAAPNNSIDIIQNNKRYDVATKKFVYTCQGGTLVYDSTNNNLLVCILDSSGVPTFKIVNVT